MEGSRTIRGVQAKLWSAHDLRLQGVKPVWRGFTRRELADPVGSLHDPDLTADPEIPGSVCGTCRGNALECKGQLSYSESRTPRVATQHLEEVMPLLNLVCERCSKSLFETGTWTQKADQLAGLDSNRPVPGAPAWCYSVLETIEVVPRQVSRALAEGEFRQQHVALFREELAKVKPLPPSPDEEGGDSWEAYGLYHRKLLELRDSVLDIAMRKERSHEKSRKLPDPDKASAVEESIAALRFRWAQIHLRIQEVERRGNGMYQVVMSRIFQEERRFHTLLNEIDALLLRHPFKHVPTEREDEVRDRERFFSLMSQTDACLGRTKQLQKVASELQQIILSRALAAHAAAAAVQHEEHADDGLEHHLKHITKGVLDRQTGLFRCHPEASPWTYNIGVAYRTAIRKLFQETQANSRDEPDVMGLIRGLYDILRTRVVKRKNARLICAMAFGGCGSEQHAKPNIDCRVVAKQSKKSVSNWIPAEDPMHEPVIKNLNPGVIWTILERISTQDLKWLGLDPRYMRPQDLLKFVIPIPRLSSMQPQISQRVTGTECTRHQDVISYQYSTIARGLEKMRQLFEEMEQLEGAILPMGELYQRTIPSTLESIAQSIDVTCQNRANALSRGRSSFLPSLNPWPIPGATKTNEHLLTVVQPKSWCKRLDTKEGLFRNVGVRPKQAWRAIITCGPAMLRTALVGGRLLRSMFNLYDVTEYNVDQIREVADWVQEERKLLQKRRETVLKLKGMARQQAWQQDWDLGYGDVYPTVRLLFRRVSPQVLEPVSLRETVKGVRYSQLIHIGDRLEISATDNDVALFNRPPTLFPPGMYSKEWQRISTDSIPAQLLSSMLSYCRRCDGCGFTFPSFFYPEEEEEDAEKKTQQRPRPAAIRHLDRAPLDSSSVIYVHHDDCPRYNADFDGDPGIKQAVQSPAAVVEAGTLASPAANILFIQGNGNIQGTNQDSTKFLFLFTERAEQVLSPVAAISLAAEIHAVRRRAFELSGGQKHPELDTNTIRSALTDLLASSAPTRCMDLLYLALPAGFCYRRGRRPQPSRRTEDHAWIENGWIVSGILTKKDVGMGEHTIWTELVRTAGQGAEQPAVEVADNVRRLAATWFMLFPETAGLADIAPPVDYMKRTRDILTTGMAQAYEAVSKLEAQWVEEREAQVAKVLACIPPGYRQLHHLPLWVRQHMQAQQQAVDDLILQQASELEDCISSQTQQYLLPESKSHLVTMVRAGAKGTIKDLDQIFVAQGMNLDGHSPMKRSLGTGKASPYARTTNRLQDMGFCAQSHARGSHPDAGVFQSIAACKTHVDSSNTVFSTGMLSRSLSLSLGSQVRRYEGVIASGLNGRWNIFADDGSAGMYERPVPLRLLEHPPRVRLADWHRVQEAYTIQQECHARLSVTGEDAFRAPFCVEDEIRKLLVQRSRGAAIVEVRRAMALVEELFVAMTRVAHHYRGIAYESMSEDEKQWFDFAPHELFAYITGELCLERVRGHWKLTAEELHQVCQCLLSHFIKSRSMPGQMVGQSAATSIGEKGTQGTLKVKHASRNLIFLGTAYIMAIATLKAKEEFFQVSFRLKDPADVKYGPYTPPILGSQRDQATLERKLKNVDLGWVMPEAGAVRHVGRALSAWRKHVGRMLPVLEWSHLDAIDQEVAWAAGVQDQCRLAYDISPQAAYVLIDQSECHKAGIRFADLFEHVQNLLPSVRFRRVLWQLGDQAEGSLFLLFLHICSVRKEEQKRETVFYDVQGENLDDDDVQRDSQEGDRDDHEDHGAETEEDSEENENADSEDEAVAEEEEGVGDGEGEEDEEEEEEEEKEDVELPEEIPAEAALPLLEEVLPAAEVEEEKEEAEEQEEEDHSGRDDDDGEEEEEEEEEEEQEEEEDDGEGREQRDHVSSRKRRRSRPTTAGSAPVNAKVSWGRAAFHLPGETVTASKRRKYKEGLRTRKKRTKKAKPVEVYDTFIYLEAVARRFAKMCIPVKGVAAVQYQPQTRCLTLRFNLKVRTEAILRLACLPEVETSSFYCSLPMATQHLLGISATTLTITREAARSIRAIGYVSMRHFMRLSCWMTQLGYLIRADAKGFGAVTEFPEACQFHNNSRVATRAGVLTRKTNSIEQQINSSLMMGVTCRYGSNFPVYRV